MKEKIKVKEKKKVTQQTLRGKKGQKIFFGGIRWPFPKSTCYTIQCLTTHGIVLDKTHETIIHNKLLFRLSNMRI